jgi:hypothetical protein
LLPIDYDTDSRSVPPRLARRTRHTGDAELQRRRVIVGYASEPSQTFRAQDGTALFDPIYQELADNAFAGLRDIAAGICGAKVHQVVELPEGTPQSHLGNLADRVRAARSQNTDLPPCCRLVKEIGQRETLQQQLADQVRMAL